MGRRCAADVQVPAPESPERAVVVDSDLERSISLGESADRLTEVARAGGMRTLWESGITHVLDGVTDLEELVRVIEVPSAVPRRSAAITPRSNAAAQQPRTQFSARSSPASSNKPASEALDHAARDRRTFVMVIPVPRAALVGDGAPR